MSHEPSRIVLRRLAPDRWSLRSSTGTDCVLDVESSSDRISLQTDSHLVGSYDYSEFNPIQVKCLDCDSDWGLRAALLEDMRHRLFVGDSDGELDIERLPDGSSFRGSLIELTHKLLPGWETLVESDSSSRSSLCLPILAGRSLSSAFVAELLKEPGAKQSRLAEWLEDGTVAFSVGHMAADRLDVEILYRFDGQQYSTNFIIGHTSRGIDPAHTLNNFGFTPLGKAFPESMAHISAERFDRWRFIQDLLWLGLSFAKRQGFERVRMSIVSPGGRRLVDAGPGRKSLSDLWNQAHLGDNPFRVIEGLGPNRIKREIIEVDLEAFSPDLIRSLLYLGCDGRGSQPQLQQLGS